MTTDTDKFFDFDDTEQWDKQNKVMIINELAGKCNNIAIEHGWWEDKLELDCTWNELVESILELEDLHPRVLAELPRILDIISSHIKITKRSDGECIALMHSELSEALEAIRKGNGADEHCPQHSNLSIELGDCIIRILDYAKQNNINIGSAIINKIEYNKSRPYKHGGKTI